MKKIQACDDCLGEEFILQGKVAVCKNCKAKYIYSEKEKDWIKTKDVPDQKQFLNETIS